MLREQAQRELDELRRQMNPQPEAIPTEKPKLEQFTTIEEYDSAVEKWARAQERRAVEEQAQQRSQAEQAMQVKARLQAREDEARTRYADYNAALAPVAPVIMSNPVLQEYVTESDLGPDVAYHLAKNPAKLVEIAELPPFAAAKELFKIEERLKSPPPKPVTKAPDPIKPVGTAEKAPFSYEAASMEEYSRRRREERRKHKG